MAITTPDVETAPSRPPTPPDRPDLLHLTCCRRDDRSLCGFELNGPHVDNAADKPCCIVCLDLNPSTQCPLDGRTCP